MLVTVEPVLLDWARKRASLTMAELAHKTGTKNVSDLESWFDSGQIPLKKLEQIALKTYVPLGYLFLDTPPAESIRIPDYRTIDGKNLSQASPELIDTLYTCTKRQAWFHEYLTEIGLTKEPLFGAFTTANDPTSVARTLRDKLDWSQEKRTAEANLELVVGKLCSAIEGLGILVMRNGVVNNNTHRKLDPKEFRGFALWDPLAPLIFVNASDAKSAQLFTLAHELGHILLGQSALSDVNVTSPSPIERWCNQVAAEILVPKSEFSQEWKALDDEGTELTRLSRLFKVSRFVILIRAYEAELIGRVEFERRTSEERERALPNKSGRGGGNFYLTQRSRLGRRFSQAVVLSAKGGRTLYKEAYDLLGIKKHETFTKIADTIFQ